MGLNKFYFLLISLLLTFYNSASAQNDLFYTDKYDANYFSNNSKSQTEMYFGSDLFQFLNSENINQIGLFIDSFLTDNKIVFDKNILFENENRFKVNIGNTNALECNKLSNAWTENYQINFLKLALQQVQVVNTDSVNWTSKKLIFYKLFTDELSRFFNPSNSVNNINIAFIIPKRLSQNEFKVVFTHFNTKRYNSRESELTATEIVANNDLLNNELQFIYPSINRQTFLKNSIGITILENLLQTVNFSTKYHINQCITSFQVANLDTNIAEFKIQIDTNILSENQFKIERLKAYKKIVEISNEQLFYYSYYDIQKLKSTLEEYNLAEFKLEVLRLNDRDKFIVGVNENNIFTIQKLKLTPFKILDFKSEIPFKLNSISFQNEADTVLLNKIEQFLKVNNNYSLAISSMSKPSEYLFIEKDKKQELINKYNETGYVISSKKNLALYRSLTVFSRLTDKEIDFKRLKCIGLTGNSSFLGLTVFIQDRYMK